jgi:putative transposase
VARRLRAAGLVGCQRRRGRGLTRRDPQAAAAPDLVDRAVTAPAPDRLWTADITECRPGRVAGPGRGPGRPVTPSRGLGDGRSLRAELVIDALDMALWNRHPAAGLIHHSDGGASPPPWRSAAAAGRPASPVDGSVGDADDNAITESVLATLECELLDRHRFPTRTQARMAVLDSLEGFSNPRRRHSALGQLSPVDHERSHQAGYAAA